MSDAVVSDYPATVGACGTSRTSALRTDVDGEKIIKYTAVNFSDFIIFNNLLQNRIITSELEFCLSQNHLSTDI